MGLLMQGMSFALEDQYANRPEVHNTAGNRSQDIKNKLEGCNEERVFSTLLGSLPSFPGGSGGDTDYQGTQWQNIGFGGIEGGADGVYSDAICEDATIPKTPDPGYDYDGTPPTPPKDDEVYIPDGGNGTVLHFLFLLVLVPVLRTSPMVAPTRSLSSTQVRSTTLRTY